MNNFRIEQLEIPGAYIIQPFFCADIRGGV